MIVNGYNFQTKGDTNGFSLERCSLFNTATQNYSKKTVTIKDRKASTMCCVNIEESWESRASKQWALKKKT